MCGIFASCMYSALIGRLLPCTSCSVVGLCRQAGVSCACVPSMLSCSSFGLPIYAQPLRLLVTHIQLGSAPCLTGPRAHPPCSLPRGVTSGAVSPRRRPWDLLEWCAGARVCAYVLAFASTSLYSVFRPRTTALQCLDVFLGAWELPRRLVLSCVCAGMVSVCLLYTSDAADE